jgi:hypothetical protein
MPMIISIAAAPYAAASLVLATVAITTLVLVGLFVSRRYFIGPLLVHRREGQPPAQLELATTIPESLRSAQTHLEQVALRLQAAGFVPAPPGVPLMTKSSRPALVQLFVNAATGDVATVMAIAAKNGVHTMQGFTTQFADETACYTGNGPLPPAIPTRPGHVRNRFPSERDPARLYVLHRAAVAKLKGKVRRPSRIDDGVAYQYDQERKSRQWMIDSGYYRLDGDRLRSTWKGACLGVWRHLPPWRTLSERREERVRRRLVTSSAAA